MAIEILQDQNTITAFLSGEIDHHTSKSLRRELDSEIERVHPEKLFIDFGKVTFMDSSGIGFIMGRYKLLSSLGGKITIKNTPPHLKRVMRLSGLNDIVTFCDTKEEEKINEN